jgi:polyphosphate kinase
MKVILNAVDYKDRKTDLDFTPDPRIVVAGADEVALMQDERKRSGKFIG